MGTPPRLCRGDSQSLTSLFLYNADTFCCTNGCNGRKLNPVMSRSHSRRIRFEVLPLGLVLVALVAGSRLAQPAAAASFTDTGRLGAGRASHTATLLPNGKILVAGGHDNSSIHRSAELYDPLTGAWTAADPLVTNRHYHTATWLPNGKLLVAGGEGIGLPARLTSAELYDPATGTWRATTNSMLAARDFHTATLLTNGMVLVTGGRGLAGYPLTNSELFDPATHIWTQTGPLGTNRCYHTATLLPNGKVLLIGGYSGLAVLGDTELYDPVTRKCTRTNSLVPARYNHTATLLPNGKVLVTGGYNGSGVFADAALFNPTNGIWEVVTGVLTDGRMSHSATLLANGQVLVVGGVAGDGQPLSSAELFNPASGSWSLAGQLSMARRVHTASLLPDGRLLVAGGHNGYQQTDDYHPRTAEVFDPATGAWAATPNNMTAARASHTATLLPNGKVLAAGGWNANNTAMLSTAELYDPTAATWVATGNNMTTARASHTATLLPTGKALVAGGDAAGNRADLYDPPAGTWAATGTLNTPRKGGHTATLLPTGKVLVTGGTNNSGVLANAELFNPTNGTWTPTGPLRTARQFHTATALPSGRVLVTGGQDAIDNTLLDAELYDPASETWTVTDYSMNAARQSHTATLLPNGKVLVAGGNDSYPAELFDRASEAWTDAGSLSATRYRHTATWLPNGKVIAVGGWNGTVTLSTAEVYDLAANIWVPTGTMTTNRQNHTATLLPNGKLLVAGGQVYTGSAFVALRSAEVYDPGLGYSPSWRPQIATCTSPLSFGNSLVLMGSKFRGISEGSAGHSQSSSADYPLVQVRSLESGYTAFLMPASGTNWSTNSFTSAPVSGFPPGWALVTVFVNAIPSTGAVFNVSGPVPLAVKLTGAQRLGGGSFQFSFTNNLGTLFSVLTTTNPALPMSQWTILGAATEGPPGRFQFTDSQAPDDAPRFYRSRSP